MTTKNPLKRNPVEASSSVEQFLSGNGPNPLLAAEPQATGPLEAEFVKGVELEVSAQDKANYENAGPSPMDELMAVLRLLADNREMIRLIRDGGCDSVTDLAKRLDRELPNVSRTLSKMAAYGLVGYLREGDDRSKKPVWLLPIADESSNSDWIEAYCLARAMRSGGLMRLDFGVMQELEGIVRGVVDAASGAFDRIAAPAGNSRRPKNVPA